VFSYMMAGNLFSDGRLESGVSPITIPEMSPAFATLGIMGELLMRDISHIQRNAGLIREMDRRPVGRSRPLASFPGSPGSP
jgi:hypothetical protein